MIYKGDEWMEIYELLPIDIIEFKIMLVNDIKQCTNENKGEKNVNNKDSRK